MASQRKDIIATGEIYHVYNRSIERRRVFTQSREYVRMKDLLWYYRFDHLPMRYSHFLLLPNEDRSALRDSLRQKNEREVTIYAYALMPNHFHLLLRQETSNGISVFLSNISNSFAKYFNTRHKRTGALWLRPFQAVRIETEDQLIHVSRYIHINPVTSYVIQEKALDDYPWTSLPEYLTGGEDGICDTTMIMTRFKTKRSYRTFIHDHVDYARQLEKVKHLAIEEFEG